MLTRVTANPLLYDRTPENSVRCRIFFEVVWLKKFGRNFEKSAQKVRILPGLAARWSKKVRIDIWHVPIFTVGSPRDAVFAVVP